MYCVKCKKATDTSNEQFTVSKNGRNMKRGTCVICGTTKTQFIKAQKGGSLLNKAINNLPFEMHLPGHNFTGSGVSIIIWRENRKLLTSFSNFPPYIPQQTQQPKNFHITKKIFPIKRQNSTPDIK